MEEVYQIKDWADRNIAAWDNYLSHHDGGVDDIMYDCLYRDYGASFAFKKTSSYHTERIWPLTFPNKESFDSFLMTYL